MTGSFGENSARDMPPYLFGCFGNGGVSLDYASAVKADISQQNYSVCPRHWYIDAILRCRRCQDTFLFAIAEQRFWYEELGFVVESFPRECLKCRRELRQLKALKQEYDAEIASALSRGADPVRKARILDVIAALCESDGDFVANFAENRRVLTAQLSRNR